MARVKLIACLVCASGVIAPLYAMDSQTVPDLSGVWGRNTLDYMPPDSGTGPLKNIGERMTVGDYKNAILQPWAAKVVKEKGDISKTGEAFHTAHNQCWPEPAPYILGNKELQILQKPGTVTLIYSHGSQVRRVRMNASHPARLTSSWYGDSVGHYEGDTLVVDTVGIKVAPLSTVDRYGTPHTDALHVVERYRPIDPNSTTAETARITRGFNPGGDIIDRTYKGNALEVAFTVEDPGAFTRPWSGKVVFRRADGLLIEDVCAESVHDYITGSDTAVPLADSTAFSGP